MFDFGDIKNDIQIQSNNIANTLALNTFNPIITFFNFYGEYLPYIKEYDTNYEDLVPGGLYKLDVVDYDYTIKLGDKHYTITPHMFDIMCNAFFVHNKLFKSANFKGSNLSDVDNTFNILYNTILLEHQKYISMVYIKYFDLFATYTIRFNNSMKNTPLIYLSYRPDIEIAELLEYIYKIYDLSLYNKIDNEIKSCDFNYYDNYYNYMYEYDKMKPQLSSYFNDIRRGSIAYFKYNDEHYFINLYPELNSIASLNNILLFKFNEELHHKENNFTYVYTQNSIPPLSEMKFMHVTSPCKLPEFYKYIRRGKTTLYDNPPAVLKVKVKK